MGKYLDSSGLSHLIGKIKAALSGKQDALVSGTNIKTINNESLLGSGNITISGGGGDYLPTVNPTVQPDEYGYANLLFNDNYASIADGTDSTTDPTSPLRTLSMAIAKGSDADAPEVAAKVYALDDQFSEAASVTAGSDGNVAIDAAASATISAPTATLSGSGQNGRATVSAATASVTGNAVSLTGNSATVGGNAVTVSAGSSVSIAASGANSTVSITGGSNSQMTLGATDVDISGNTIDISSSANGITGNTTLTGAVTLNGTFSTNNPAGVRSAIGAQETLTSGTNIKTVNNESLLGSGNISISGGGSKTTWYGTCSTTASTSAKVVTCADYALVNGAIIAVLFTTANTAATPTLNINSTGAKSIYVGTSTPNSTTNVLKWNSNTLLYFIYDGTYYRFLGSIQAGTVAPSRGANTWYGECSSNATATAKTSTISNFVLTQGAVVVIQALAASTVENALTLNVSSTGAKTIYYKQAATSSTNPLKWAWGDVLVFVYNGANWRYVGGSSAMDEGSLPIASTSTLGGVKVGNGFDVSADGTLSRNTSYSGNTVVAAVVTDSGNDPVIYHQSGYDETLGESFDELYTETIVTGEGRASEIMQVTDAGSETAGVKATVDIVGGVTELELYSTDTVSISAPNYEVDNPSELLSALGIQAGTFSMTPVANGTTSETITFDRAYASMPIVFADVASGVEATLRDRRFGATATTTDITITCYNAGTNTTSRRVNWLAIGEYA